MKWTAIVVAFFAAAVAAAPLAEPDAAPAADLTARQTTCTDCNGGSHTCCDLTACFVTSC
jgi:hypothetical protein